MYVQGACWVYGLVVDARAAEGIAVAIADERRLLVDGYAEDIGAAGLQVADGLVRLEFEDVAAEPWLTMKTEGGSSDGLKEISSAVWSATRRWV